MWKDRANVKLENINFPPIFGRTFHGKLRELMEYTVVRIFLQILTNVEIIAQ